MRNICDRVAVQGEREMRTRKLRLGRALSRGLTLVELIIVITIIGVLMGVIAVGVFKKKQDADKGTAKIFCQQLRTTAIAYKAKNPEVDCPTPDQLKAEKELDSTSNLKDPWGQPYQIKCEIDEVYAFSAGPDKQIGTEDDIRIPPPEKAAK